MHEFAVVVIGGSAQRLNVRQVMPFKGCGRTQRTFERSHSRYKFVAAHEKSESVTVGLAIIRHNTTDLAVR